MLSIYFLGLLNASREYASEKYLLVNKTLMNTSGFKEKDKIYDPLRVEQTFQNMHMFFNDREPPCPYEGNNPITSLSILQ